jgi:hypothetical protein
MTTAFEIFSCVDDSESDEKTAEDSSPSALHADRLRALGHVPHTEFKSRKVPLLSYVPRSKDYYACVAVTRLSVQETLATHPKIEANHELRSELDHLTKRIAEQLEDTPVDQRKTMVDTVGMCRFPN